MTLPSPQSAAPSPALHPDGLVLRSSPELAYVPTARPPLVIPEVKIVPAEAAAGTSADGGAAAATLEPSLLIGLAAAAGAGWLLERRRRRRLETEKDSVLWADVQAPPSSIITTAGDLDAIVRPAASASPPPSAMHIPILIESTSSRREATLIDLQQLAAKLRRRRNRGDLHAAVALLQQHLADFRYTSPWVFLELRELHLLLGRDQEWEATREMFRRRFNQKAPVWQAPSTAEVQLADDAQISSELAAEWPYREARMVILHWLLGDPENAPPLLALGVSRDLLFLDRLLDGLMIARPPATDFML